jgi:ABC-type transport system involved in cytochrome bd biosynthesis fused ATPase/permease subunit
MKISKEISCAIRDYGKKYHSKLNAELILEHILEYKDQTTRSVPTGEKCFVHTKKHN